MDQDYDSEEVYHSEDSDSEDRQEEMYADATDLPRILQCDDRDSFVSTFQSGVGVPQSDIFPQYIMSMICSNNNLKCAKAVLEGETHFKKEAFITPSGSNTSNPLHHAALGLQPQMIDLCLSYGVSTDSRCVTDDEYNKMLPLNVALQQIRKHGCLHDWTIKRHVFDLISRLCLPQMRKALETVKLLAQKTPQVEEEIYHYAKEGKVLELAALLMGAREKVLSPVAGSMILRQFITSEITLLVAIKMRLEHNRNYELVRKCKDKHLAMVSSLLLIEVIERAGDELAAYIKLERTKVPDKQVAEEVAWILKEVGFNVKPEDIDLSHANLVKATSKFSASLDVDWNYLTKFVRAQDSSPREFKLDDFPLPRCLDLSSFQVTGMKEDANLQKRAEKDSDAEQKERRLSEEAPFERWRFASTTHLHGSQSLSIQLSNRLQVLKSIPDDEELKKCYSNTLSEAIETFCNHQYLKDWNPNVSIIKLLYILCQPKLEEELLHIMSLSFNVEEIEALGCHYSKEGRPMQLAVLLMVAQLKSSPLYEGKLGIDERINREISFMLIRRTVMSKIQKLIDEEIGLAGGRRNGELVRKCKDKKERLLSTLLVLDVFELAGRTIAAYLTSSEYLHMQQQYSNTALEERVARDVAVMLKELGFFIKHNDTFLNDLNCFSFKLGPEQEEYLRRSLRRERASPPPKSQLKKVSNVKRVPPPTASTPRSFSSLCSPVRSLHTSPILNSEPPLSKFSSGKQWAVLASTIRKGIKHF